MNLPDCGDIKAEHIEILDKLSQKGDPYASYCLGLHYHDGVHVQTDIDKAFALYEKASLRGHVGAMTELCISYSDKGAPKFDYELGRQWCQKAAVQGDKTAQFYLAVHFYEGNGTKVDHDSAFLWAKKAADQGVPSAQHFLATLYLRGQGTQMDFQEAMRLLKLASDSGYEIADQLIKVLNTHFEKWADNKQKQEQYMIMSSKKPGVVTTESGLQYKVIREGSGPRPNYQDIVSVHYSGKLIDGYEFDSSYKRGAPSTFPLQKVIQGWVEGIQYMRVGSKYELIIPFKLAYDAGGAGKLIKPYDTLIFEIELLNIVK